MVTDKYSRPASLVFFHAVPMSWLAAWTRKSGGFLVITVVGNQLDLDVERQGTQCAGVAVVFCGEGADVSHDVSPFG